MTEASRTGSLAPTAPAERIDALDVVRGFALFGIFLMNVEYFSRPLQDIDAEGIDTSTRGASYLVEWLTYFFVQGKFWTLFALLFGMGFALMIERAARADRPFVPAYLRRTLALLGIGAIHALLIWSGDILVTYAIGALLLLMVRQARRAWQRWSTGAEPTPMTAARLARWGAALYALPLVLILTAGALGSLQIVSVTPEQQAERTATQAEEAAIRDRAAQVYGEGGYVEAVGQRLTDTAGELGSLPVTLFWVLGIFLMGAALLRSGVLSNLRAHDAGFRRVRNIGLPLGFALMAVSTWLGTTPPSGELDFRDAIQVVAYLVGALVLALAYGATLVTALRGRAGEWLRTWLAPAGRMALTNYLLQSVVATLVFYHYGLGLWGQLGRAQQAFLVIAVFALQLIFSRWWLRRYRFGPVEWLWRAITYLKAPPMRA